MELTVVNTGDCTDVDTLGVATDTGWEDDIMLSEGDT